jgi:sugar lactone lactonase YvrE
VNEEGDILLLAYKDSSAGIIRCNYRGEPRSRIDFRNIPSEFSDFSPNRMLYQNGIFYLANTGDIRIVVTDREGNFRRGYDLVRLLDFEESDRGNKDISGFSIDGDGNILFTIPVMFTAYILSPDGKINSFGKPGGAPGRFNIVAGIARDSRGNYLIVDKLKAAVQVFDKNFNFLMQLGSRGYRPGNLIYPDDIAIDGGDRIYVTQMARRGVSVYKLSYN